jgi:response regulator RpfG family c-di-GMP phosphodiesterase
MNEKILCVDDDFNILQAYKRILHKDFAIEIAEDGQSGLDAVRARGPFAVVVSDLRMPGMDGIQFLAAVRECATDSVRIMLTGRADLSTAIAAVNEGNIFRFLTKPCSSEMLSKALHAALEQHRLITAERLLLKKTLLGSVQVLTETLSLVNPTAFSRASRIKGYVKHIATQLRLPNAWQFELAALLSQIGCVTLPPEVLDKVYTGQPLSPDEQEMFTAHPKIASDLLAKIPRLESVAHMIAGQQIPPPIDRMRADEPMQKDPIALGAHMLKVALDLDRLVASGASAKAAIAAMRERPDHYLPSFLDALDNIEVDQAPKVMKTVWVRELTPFMTLDEDIRAKSGSLLLAKGHQLTPSIIERLRNFARTAGVVEPFRVLLPRETSQPESTRESKKGAQ